MGFETQFEIRNQGKVFPHRWTVTNVVPLKSLEYNWKYDGYRGDSFVAFELFEQNDLTTLRLTARVVESFPEDIPEFTRESGIGGWTYFIKQSLRIFLAGTQ